MGRFKDLVDTEEGMRSFRSKYNIPPHVGVRYAAQGEWFDERKTNEVVISMIAFIEGGMTIPMGTLPGITLGTLGCLLHNVHRIYLGC